MASRDLVLGFDPASRAGWAVLDFDGRVIESGTWLLTRGDYTGDRWNYDRRALARGELLKIGAEA